MTKHFLAVGLVWVLLSAWAVSAEAQLSIPDDARAVLRQTVTQLQTLAEQYLQAGNTASANAVLNQVRSLQLTINQSLPILRMKGYRPRVGETFRVQVTGSDASGRGIWGTDIYTDDSDLSLVVVHAGLLGAGQEGEVLVTFLPGQTRYQGSARYGVLAQDFNIPYPGSYRVARADAASAALPVLPPPN